MSDRSSPQGSSSPKKFVPALNPLENRLVLSRTICFPDGHCFIFPDLTLPRTGGISVQNGSVLSIGVGQPTRNTAQVTDDGKGDIQAQWNGGPVHSFAGVGTTVIQAQRARNNQITFHLTGPRTSPTAVAVGTHLSTDASSASEGGHPLRRIARTGGTAVQSGSILTVAVNKPKTNSVEISNNGAGKVQVEWNGGAVHDFAGVETIVVDAKNGRKVVIGLNDSSLSSGETM